jgi:chromosome segregation ATPase
MVKSGFARTLERELSDAKAECKRLKFALVEWEAKERGWSKAVEKDAAELARLRALVGTIRSQLNLTVRNVSDITPEEHSHETGEAIDHLRAEVERLKEQLRIESAASAHALHWAEKAEAERDALAKDKARLDWLEKNWIHWPITQNEETIRAAIDAAMKGTP